MNGDLTLQCEIAYWQGVAAERARCIKVLEDLTVHKALGVEYVLRNAAIAAVAATPPETTEPRPLAE